VEIKSMVDRVALLIDVLFDPTAREDEKDDAAMDLGDYNDNRALHALLKIASNFNETDIVLQSAGESIGRIWVKQNQFDIEEYKKLHPDAQSEIYAVIQVNKPEWVETFAA